jgi:hypothetical protein
MLISFLSISSGNIIESLPYFLTNKENATFSNCFTASITYWGRLPLALMIFLFAEIYLSVLF